MSASALSHAVASLERRLGVRLFHRTTRSVSLSEAGTRFVERVRPALRDIAAAIETVNDFRDTPTGTLRINTAVSAAAWILELIVLPFLARHPDMRIDLVTDDRLVDIVAAGFDAGIRLAETVPRDMIAIPCSPSLRFVVVGTPGYFARRGRPRSPGDLHAHTCIRRRMASGALAPWEFERAGETVAVDVDGALTLDTSELMVAAASRGAGLAWVNAWSVERLLAQRRLVTVLDDWCPPFPGLCLYYPARQASAGLRAFIKMIRASGLTAAAPPVTPGRRRGTFCPIAGDRRLRNPARREAGLKSLRWRDAARVRRQHHTMRLCYAVCTPVRESHSHSAAGVSAPIRSKGSHHMEAEHEQGDRELPSDAQPVSARATPGLHAGGAIVRAARSLGPPHVLNIDDLRRRAKRRLPRVVFDYLDGGADDEITLRENCRVFEDVTFRPRNAVAMPSYDLRTRVLDSELALPALLAPIGCIRLIHPVASSMPHAPRARPGRRSSSPPLGARARRRASGVDAARSATSSTSWVAALPPRPRSNAPGALASPRCSSRSTRRSPGCASATSAAA